MNYKIVSFDEKYVDPFVDLYINISSLEDHRWTKENARYYLVDLGVKELEKYTYFALDEDDNLLGGVFAGIRPFFDKKTLHINCIAVFDEYQKLGIGNKLFYHVVDLAKNSPDTIKFVTIEIDVQNNHPKKWYESLGFQDSKWSIYYCDLENFNFKKKLNE